MDFVGNFGRDLQSCSSMGVSCSGHYALFAGRRVLGLLDLDNPSSLVYREARQSKWDVITCQFSILEEKMAAIASNNKVEIITPLEQGPDYKLSLKAHTRAITDLAWHTHNRNLLATSAADAYIYLWDFRDHRRPKIALQAVAGAVKVKWNKVSDKYLASAHEGEVKLWDIRTSKSPVQYINAHFSRIYDMDWSHEDENYLVTTSQDLTVKYWNISNPNKTERIIKMQTAPVWRVSHTPFGHGLLTLGMQTVVRGENNISLWNNNNLQAPVHTYYLPDMILDLAWRQWPDSNRNQLVTWSKDMNLRVWNINLDLQEKCGVVIEDSEIERSDEFEQACADQTTEATRVELDKKLDSYVETEEDETVVVASPVDIFARPFTQQPILSESVPNSFFDRKKTMNLNYEFSLINISDKLVLENEDAGERVFSVSANTSKNKIVLNVKFPVNYPNQVAPTFSFLEGTTIDNISRNNIIQKLKNAAKQQTSKNRRCLESCLRQFEVSIEALNHIEEEQMHINNPQLLKSTTAQSVGQFPDHNVPFPRSSGAKFCGDGQLVCFGVTRQYTVKMESPDVDQDEVDLSSSLELAKTPRALSALSSKISLLSSGATSPKYGNINVMSLFDQKPSQEFPFTARVSRVRFSTQKSRNLSVSSADDLLFSTNHEKRKKSSIVGVRSRRQAETKMTKLTIYNCSALMPYSKVLAEKYMLPASPQASQLSLSQICSYNAQVAMECDRPDLHQTWSLAAVVSSADKSVEDNFHPWAAHPCGRPLLTSLVNHYVDLKDVQTAAALVAIFGNKTEFTPRVRKKNSKSESLQSEKESVYSGSFYFTSSGKHNRSNSDTQNDESGHCARTESYPQGMAGSHTSQIGFDLPIYTEYRLRSRRSSVCSEDEDFARFWEDSRLLDPRLSTYYDQIIEAYSDLLYRWKLFKERAEVVKGISELKNLDKYTTYMSLFCPTCGKVLRGPWCVSCHALALRCCVCQTPCRGLVSLCQHCGHGGHTLHLNSWFKTSNQCPTGCGCECPNKIPIKSALK